MKKRSRCASKNSNQNSVLLIMGLIAVFIIATAGMIALWYFHRATGSAITTTPIDSPISSSENIIYTEITDQNVYASIKSSKSTCVYPYYKATLKYMTPMPTKSLQSSTEMLKYGMYGTKPDLKGFYLQEGPLTKRTTAVINAATEIKTGTTTEETVMNIITWIHANLEENKIKHCDNRRDSVSANTIITRECASGCTDYVVAFAAIARAKGLSATVTETVDEAWIVDMVAKQKFTQPMSGHFFSEVYFPELDKWVVVDPTKGVISNRYYDNIYNLNCRYYLFFERGLDPTDYGITTTNEFKTKVKSKYYIGGGSVIVR